MRSLLYSVVVALGIAAPLARAADVPQVSSYFFGQKSGLTAHGKAFVFEWRFAKYDGRHPSKWVGGDSLDPPKYVVETISLQLEGKSVAIPPSAYADIYDPGVQSVGPYIMEDSTTVYLVVGTSDGAGSAEVWLRISGGKYVGRIVKQCEE